MMTMANPQAASLTDDDETLDKGIEQWRTVED